MDTESSRSDAPAVGEGVWSQQEHDRYLEALQLFPGGPWKDIADHVGSRSVRQVQTHAQKYHEKVARRLRGLRKERKKLLRPEHRIDDNMMSLCREVESERLSTVSSVSSVDSADMYSEPLGFHPHPHDPDEHRPRWGVHDFARSTDFESRASADSFQSYGYMRQAMHSPPIAPAAHHRAPGSELAFPDANRIEYAYPDAFRSEHYLARRELAVASATAHAPQSQRPRPELPSFQDAMDFLIEFFGSKESNDAMWYRHHQRRL